MGLICREVYGGVSINQAVPALPLGGCLGRWAKGDAKNDQKYNCVVQKVTNENQVQ